MIDPNLYINPPVDAGSGESRTGDNVEVFNERGRIRTVARLTEDVPPRVSSCSTRPSGLGSSDGTPTS